MLSIYWIIQKLMLKLLGYEEITTEQLLVLFTLLLALNTTAVASLSDFTQMFFPVIKIFHRCR